MHEISGVMTPACVAALKKAKRKGSPKGCVVILNEYKLQRGEEGESKNTTQQYIYRRRWC